MSPATKRPERVLSGGPPPRPVVIGFAPSVDGGARYAKALLGEVLTVEADVIVDGHDLLACEVRYRPPGERRTTRCPLEPVGNDRYATTLAFGRLGRHELFVVAGVDPFASWQHGARLKAEADQDLELDLAEGAELLAVAAKRATGAPRRALEAVLSSSAGATPGPEALLDPALGALARQYLDPSTTVTTGPWRFEVERERAAVGAWYELFPRSAATEAGRHGTLADVEARLPYLEQLGVDVLYLPPVHPIGTTMRKGRNGSVRAAAGDPGSPWAIGAATGGHEALHPELGTFEDFDHLVTAAARVGIEVAIDLALQCSPDHPWVAEHPDWFRHRADGSVAYAENPPKRYEDIYPFDFASRDWASLWEALAGVVSLWIGHGVRIFRVDNPHTKPFAFWEWLIARVRGEDPTVVFLAEAFTRPKVMYELAKLGFSQSYTYFTWRHRRGELEEYLRELTSPEVRAFFRPNLFTNTPDILTAELQGGGRPAFALRALLAATLGASWGIYGPLFELAEGRPREPGSEEYLNSEKYELRHFNWAAANSLAPFVATLNGARRRLPALANQASLHFHGGVNPELICYSKRATNTRPEHLLAPPDDAAALAAEHPAPESTVICVVNLDPHYPQSGWVELDAGALGRPDGEAFTVRDHLSGQTFNWRAGANFVLLDPAATPGHLLEVLPRREGRAR